MTTDTPWPDNARQTGPALEKMDQFLLWLVPTVERFPRSQTFLPGNRIQTTALDAPELLIEATCTRSRARLLADAISGWKSCASCSAWPMI